MHNAKAAAIGALCGAAIVGVLRIGVFTAERDMLRREHREMKQVWDEVSKGGYERCFNGYHTHIEGDGTPYVGEKVFHWHCRILDCYFQLQSQAVPLKGIGVEFDGNRIVHAPEKEE